MLTASWFDALVVYKLIKSHVWILGVIQRRKPSWNKLMRHVPSASFADSRNSAEGTIINLLTQSEKNAWIIELMCTGWRSSQLYHNWPSMIFLLVFPNILFLGRSSWGREAWKSYFLMMVNWSSKWSAFWTSKSCKKSLTTTSYTSEIIPDP